MQNRRSVLAAPSRSEMAVRLTCCERGMSDKRPDGRMGRGAVNQLQDSDPRHITSGPVSNAV